MARRQGKGIQKLGAALGTLVLALASYYLSPQAATTETSKSESLPNIHYTRHAQCRMKCRFFTKTEIKDVIRSGKINHKKSDPSAKPCPVTAKEKVTSDGQKARVVFARCKEGLRIITAIDLGQKHSCDCP